MGAFLVLVLCALSSLAQQRSVALTFDDLPVAGAADPAEARSINTSILDSLDRHQAPAIGFVIESRVQEKIPMRLAQAQASGFDPAQRGATWTYLTTDQPFGSATERMLRGFLHKVPRIKSSLETFIERAERFYGGLKRKCNNDSLKD
jgi:peptidoglycan/xylan/chitin deacetylase (PgdA/CDA1 family)